MIANKFGVMEPEPGETMIWFEASNSEWVVEYFIYGGILDDHEKIERKYHSAPSLRSAIVLAREKITELKYNLRYAGFKKKITSKAYFLVPDSSEYLDVTDDADAILVLFQYENN